MSARALAARLHEARASRRAAEAAGDARGVAVAQRAVEVARAALAALSPEERGALWDPAQPLACLPVRIETAFLRNAAGRPVRLRLRVYPDTVHVEPGDTRPTTREMALARQVAARVAAAPAEAAALARWMDTQTGAARGAAARARLARGDTGTRPAQGGAVRACLLPDLWQAGLKWPGGSLDATFPAPVAEPLTLGPSAEDVGGALDPAALAALWAGGAGAQARGMAWMVDFDAALAVGMALDIDLGAPRNAALRAHLDAGGQIDTVTVWGVRWATADMGADDMARALQAHALGHGARIAAQGSATANDGGRTTPGAPDTLGGANAARLADALGVPRDAVAACGDVARNEDADAAAMASALWPGGMGLYARASLGLSPESAEPLRAFWRDDLRARGPLPALQLGREPYGVLPLTLDAAGPGGLPEPAAPPEAVIATAVAAALDRVPRRRPDTARPPDVDAWLDRFLRDAHPHTVLGLPWTLWTDDGDAAFARLLTALGLPERAPLRRSLPLEAPIEVAPRLPLSRYPSDAPQRTDRHEGELLRPGLSLADLLDLLPPDRWPVKPYREMPQVRRLSRAGTGWHVQQDGAAPGDPLLFTVLRHALFTHFVDILRLGVAASGQAVPPLNDPDGNPARHPLIDAFTDLTGVALSDIAVPLPRDVAGRLGLPGWLVSQNRDLARAIDALAGMSPEARAWLFTEQLGLFSARPDAWVTALDARLLQRRRKAAPRGLLIGGYGRVCGLAPGDAAAAGEYLPAPGLAQAATGAVLRQAWRDRQARGGAADSFALDLSSGRVAAAQDILSALRAGHALGAVLGQRVEAALRRDLSGRPAALEATVQALRRLAPLREGVVDAAPARGQSADPPDGATLASLPPGDIPPDARGAVAALRDDLDGIADLLLAESVHGIVTAGPDRAGAALDALSRGAALPDRLAVVETARAARGLEVRCFALGAAVPVPPDEAAPTRAAYAGARRVACGALAGILDAALGPLDRLGAWVAQADGAATWVPLDWTGLDAVALVLGMRGGTHPELATSIGTAIDADRPGPNGQPPLSATLAVLAALRRAYAGARPLAPSDLAEPGAPGSGAHDQDDLRTRADHVMRLARSGLAALRAAADAQALRDALADLAALGRSDALCGPGDDPAETARAAASSLTADLDAAEAAGAPLDRVRAILGAEFPVAPVLDAPAIASLRSVASHGAALTGAGTARRLRWLRDAAQVRPKLADATAALEGAESLRGESLLHVAPGQAAGDAWCAAAAPQGAPTGWSGAIIGPMPSAVHSGVVLDDWSESLPDAMHDAAMAIETPRPGARAPAAILLAMTEADRWTEDAPRRALDRAFELAGLRGLGADDLGPLSALPPVLSFQDMPE